MKIKIRFIFLMFFVQTSFGQFITTWQTLSDNRTITIPTNSAYTYDYTVDWGDGTTSANQTGDASHNYVLKGTYTVSITGTFPAIYVDFHADAKSFLKTVEQWGDNPWESMAGAFEGCTYFRVLATDIPDLSNVTDMSYMFSAINGNFDEDDDIWNIPNIENWDVSNVTNMSSVFNFMQGFNQDISGWDVSKVTNMSQMFRFLRNFNQDISGWDVSNVTDMSFMFDFANSFNQDISGWDVSNVTDMKEMFEGASVFNQDIGGWDVSKVTDMNKMLDDSGLSSDNYDALLTGWAAQTLTSNVSLGATGLIYCNSIAARTILVSEPNNWTITGDDTNCSAITLIPDTNFEQYLIDANIDSDGTINGEVFTTDIENVTQVSATGRNITDLTGIEDFTSLETLRVFDNALTVLNVSQNLELKELRCFNNQITALDVSNNVLLEDVKVYNNALTSLNVKNGNNSNITTFEATGNSSLTCIDVDDLSFTNTNWTDIDSQTSFSLDCSSTGGGTVSIPDAYFEDYLESIGAGNGINFDGLADATEVAALTSVDLNGLGTVENLSGIEFFTSLTYLNVSGNVIESVDVSSNTLLSYLDVSDNNLTSLDVSNNTKLGSLIVSNNSLTSLDVTKLIDLERLRCNSNQLSELNVTENILLTELNCNSNSLVNLNLLSNTSLEQLYVESNSLEYLDLSQNSSLTTVTCILNSLVGLNLKNGNNTLITNSNFAAFDNPSLSCIQVDDVNYSNSNWAQIGMGSSYSENCTPANDDCSFPISITLGQDTPGDTTSASSGSNNPNCAQSGIVLFDVWYQVEAPASGSIVLNLSAQPLRAKIAIYNSCTDAQPFACDEDTLSVDNLTPGQTYYLQVWLESSSGGRNITGETGSFTLLGQDASTLSTTNLEEENMNLMMYPNPSTDYVNVSLKNNDIITKVTMYSLSGKKVLETKNEESTIDVSQLSKGIYLVKVLGKTKTYMKKLLIE